MERYRNRQDAGLVLADALREYAGREDVIVLALPRGGVPVAFEVAKALHVPLDVFIVRKLGVPGHVELAMGALATSGVVIFNQHIIQELNISEQAIQSVIDQETQELKRREKAYRGDKPPHTFKGKIVILIDDGIATGASMRAAVKAIRQLHPTKLVVAVPVAEQQICLEIANIADQFICPLRPVHFYAVGAWYDDFSQTEDEEVHALLTNAEDDVLHKED
jgi:putative phosphoribosyl transferase